MINDKITDKELEMFAAEPENNLAFVPNHAMTQKMAKELLAHRKAWGEPAAYEVKGLLCHTIEEAEIYVGEPEPLYRKPSIE